MAKILGLDIPPGLITQFENALTYVVRGLTPTLSKRKPKVSYASQISFANYSLFVKWKDLWGSFLAPRKLAWAIYWESLPFGAHSGSGGWPGSGYSAFIYVNAPRYMAGLELLLDPPAEWGTEICPDPFFADGGLWTLDGDCTITGGKLIFSSVGGSYQGTARIEVPMTFDLRERRYQFVIKIPDGVDPLLSNPDGPPFDATIMAGDYTDGGGQIGNVAVVSTADIATTFNWSGTFIHDPDTRYLGIEVSADGDLGDIEVSFASLREEII